ncbi:substrate-binding domain-containing protein [Chitinimonas sp.]|uniref:substrate-binding domain-containing protein n=1 Tax=Chitinimonas sp. TaxID=1934313 RepID=UPI0035B230F5
MNKLMYIASLAGWLLLGAAGAHADEARPLRSVAFSVGSISNPFFGALIRGAEAKARSINPTVKFEVLSSDYSIPIQLAHLQKFTNEHVDLILINAADPHRLSAAIEKARTGGAVVVAVDVLTDGADASVLTDNRRAGELACTYLAQALGKQGRVVLQSGPQVSSVLDRMKGCRSVLGNYPQIRILSDSGNGMGSRWGGMRQMQADIKRFGQIDGVFAINDPQAIGTNEAAQQAGIKQLVVTAVDGSPDIEKALRSPSFVAASASQAPYLMAQRAVEIGFDILNGHRPPSPTILLEPGLVDRDSISRYQGWQSSLPVR